MRKLGRLALVTMLVASVLAIAAPAGAARVDSDVLEGRYRGMAIDGGTLYLTPATGSPRIEAVDIASASVTDTWALAGTPGPLAISADRTLLYVGNSGGWVDEVSTTTGSVLRTFSTGAVASSDVVSTVTLVSGSYLYVGHGVDEIVQVDLGSGVAAEFASVSLLNVSSPRIFANGTELFVAEQLGFPNTYILDTTHPLEPIMAVTGLQGTVDGVLVETAGVVVTGLGIELDASTLEPTGRTFDVEKQAGPRLSLNDAQPGRLYSAAHPFFRVVIEIFDVASATEVDRIETLCSGMDILDFVVSHDEQFFGVLVDDGRACVVDRQGALPTCQGLEATRIGTTGNDILRGTQGPDVIIGLGGMDYIEARGGDDVVCAGPGDDQVLPGPGSDTVDGGDGVDDIDYRDATNGVTVDLQTGVVVGSGPNEVISSFENIVGSPHDDRLFGDAGSNRILGWEGDDFIVPRAGDDVAYGNTDRKLGSNHLGNVIVDGPGEDTIGGPATADYRNANGPVVVARGPGIPTTATSGGEVDRLEAIRSIKGSDFDDYLDAKWVWGRAGDDELLGEIVRGGSGNDTITANGGPASLHGGTGDDVIDGSGLDAFIEGGAGHDDLRGGDGHDIIDGGSGNDVLRGGRNRDLLLGGPGNDTIFGGTADDVLLGEGGNDHLYGGDGVDVASFALATRGVVADLDAAKARWEGADTLTAIESLVGSPHRDQLRGDALGNRIDGGDGDDVLSGRGGDDLLWGEAGADTAFGSFGSDTCLDVESVAGCESTGTGVPGDPVYDWTPYIPEGHRAALVMPSSIQVGPRVRRSRRASRRRTSRSGVLNLVLALVLAGGAIVGPVGPADAVVMGEAVPVEVHDVVVVGGKAYVAVALDVDGPVTGSVHVYDVATAALLDSWPTVGVPESLALGAGGTELYVVSSFRGLDVFDAATGSILRTMPVAGVAESYLAHSVAVVGPTEAYVGSNFGQVTRVDPMSFSIEAFGGDVTEPEVLSHTLGIAVADTGSVVIRDTGSPGFPIIAEQATSQANGGVFVQGDAWFVTGAGIELDGSTLVPTGRSYPIGGAAEMSQAVTVSPDGTALIAARTRAGKRLVLEQYDTTSTDLEATLETTCGAAFNSIALISSAPADGTHAIAHLDADFQASMCLVDEFRSLPKCFGATPTIIGTNGDDVLTGTSGPDVILGLAGDDVLIGMDGADRLCGGPGNDIVRPGKGSDRASGSFGVDTLDYSDSTVGVTVDLQNKIVLGSGNSEVIAGFENATGGSGNDTLLGTSGPNVLDGGFGSDVLEGRAGNDTILGGTGNNTSIEGPGNDFTSHVEVIDYANAPGPIVANTDLGASTGFGDDTFEVVTGLYGGPFDDSLVATVVIGRGGDDLLRGDEARGGDGNDTLIGDGNGAILIGGAGNDVLTGTPGPDTMVGGSGNDVLHGRGNEDFLDGGSGDDVLHGGLRDDLILGGPGSDQLYGEAGDDTLAGELGNDLLDGGAGLDTASFAFAPKPVDVDLSAGTASGEGSDSLVKLEFIVGGPGNDTLRGTNGQNIIESRAGNDLLVGLGGDDILWGQEGTDTANGGSGDDTCLDAETNISCETIDTVNVDREVPWALPAGHRGLAFVLRWH